MENQESKYILYTKSTCPFCIRAEELLKIYDMEYETICLDTTPLLFEQMKDNWNWKTVPMIFECKGDNPSENLEFIGGYSDLEKKFPDE